MLRGYSGSEVSCLKLSIIPAVPGNCGAFDSTFERQGEFIPVEDLFRAFGRDFTIKMAPQCRAFTGLCIEEN